MAVVARVEVETTVRSTDPPKDIVTNTLHFSTDGLPGPSDWQALADKVKNMMYSTVGYGSSIPWTAYGGRFGRVVAYDLADPRPRPEKGVSLYTPSSPESSALGPRAVSCCLSFYCQRNIKRQRGRIYIGPFTSGTDVEKPSNNTMTMIIDLAKGLSGFPLLSGMSWSHVLHSPTANNNLFVDHYWCNDVWDIIRSRLSKETTRKVFP